MGEGQEWMYGRVLNKGGYVGVGDRGRMGGWVAHWVGEGEESTRKIERIP